MSILHRFSALAGIFSLSLAVLIGLATSALAGSGQPVPWQTGFQPAASPTMQRIDDFNDWLYPLIIIIVIFVMALMGYTMWRFSEKRNPVPSKTTHNITVEIVWTIVPLLIVLSLFYPSFKLLYFADSVENPDMTIKAIGRQWYWSYEYPDNGNFTFDANMVPDEDLKPGQPRLLATDNAIVVPVGTKIRLLITASDVLHAFAMPSMGLKLDAVPGRINEVWVEVLEEGTYYGQCSELCGTGHSYMPIQIDAVSKAAFDSWVKQAQEQFARVDEPAAPAAPEAAARLAAKAE